MPHPTLSRRQFADFSGLITERLGIKMPPSKHTMLQSRIYRRMRQLGMEDFSDYHGRFFGNASAQAAELDHLLDLATTNKTDFFREPDHFTLLAERVLPQWRKRRPDATFRVWCAGCSSGEEAYTIAMVLAEEARRSPFPYSILATDICTSVLQEAREAVYDEAHAAPIPPQLRQRYLLRGTGSQSGRVRLSPEIRIRVRFGRLNFLSESYGIREAFDAVFFRNVMIYFDRATQGTVAGRICRHLRPEGTLFIAHAETLQGQPLPLRPDGASVYRREPDKAARP